MNIHYFCKNGKKGGRQKVEVNGYEWRMSKGKGGGERGEGQREEETREREEVKVVAPLCSSRNRRWKNFYADCTEY